MFSTPFDETAVDFLEQFDPPAYKIASFELVDLPLMRRIAATGRPTILSTGMATPDEIAETVATFRDAGGRDLVLLHCVSGYPTPAEQSNLRRIPALAAEFGCPVGLSDHTLGIEVAIASVALGACLIEKHFTLRRADGGPDAAFSLEPDELAALVRGGKCGIRSRSAPARLRARTSSGAVWCSAARSTSCATSAQVRPSRREHPRHPAGLRAAAAAPAGDSSESARAARFRAAPR